MIEEKNQREEEKEAAPLANDIQSDTPRDSASEKHEEETVSTVYTPNGSAFFCSEDKSEESRERIRGRGVAATAMLLVICFLLGAVGGAVGVTLALRYADGAVGSTESTEQPTPTDTVTIYKGDKVNVVPLPKDDELLSAAEVYAKVANSVVSITTSVQMSSSFYGGFYVTSGAGSGIVLTESGHIATNYHVIDGADAITVTMLDGKEYTASYLDGDEALDIALLKIEPEERIFPVLVGSSDDLLIGQEVFAIGNPLGEFSGTLTDGIISSLNRTVEIDGYYRTLIQTDAAVNPGSSGGGLFDRYGRLCGIVNAKESSEGVEGLGFAIPIDTVFELFVEIIEKGYIRDRAVLDLDVKRLSSANEAFYLYGNQNIGLYVTESYYGDEIDIKAGDRIVAIDGVNVNHESDLHAILTALKPGDTVTLTLGRVVLVSNGLFGTYTEEMLDVTVTLIEFVPSSSVTFH